jgi:NADH-quinone oxidoreductase subunit J
MIETFLFYVFSTVLILSALMVVIGHNPVHSVLFLILSFFNAAALFILLKAEFLAMILLIVYVGAVAVLFLFVVMMIDINLEIRHSPLKRYKLFGISIFGILLSEFILLFKGMKENKVAQDMITSPAPSEISNTKAIGNILYTDYAYIVEIAGMILLVAMIGAIVLTLRQRNDALRQDISKQNQRNASSTLKLHKVPFNKGVIVP